MTPIEIATHAQKATMQILAIMEGVRKTDPRIPDVVLISILHLMEESNPGSPQALLDSYNYNKDVTKKMLDELERGESTNN